MHFKLIITFVDDNKTSNIMEAAREAGATGATIITSARGEGMEKVKTFFGMALDTPRDVVMLLVEEHLARSIMERISEVGGFDTSAGTGIAFQVDVEDAIGVAHQIRKLENVVENSI